MDLPQPYRNQTNTGQYAADKPRLGASKIACKTAESLDERGWTRTWLFALLIRRSQVRILPGALPIYLQITYEKGPRQLRWDSFDATVAPPADQESAASQQSKTRPSSQRKIYQAAYTQVQRKMYHLVDALAPLPIVRLCQWRESEILLTAVYPSSLGSLVER
jgi:hypothetical protein